jgi:predicted Zn-dependent protease
MSIRDMDAHRPAAVWARRGILACAAGLTLAFSPLLSAPLAAQSVSIVRDAETEALLQDYLAPIFRAAGVRGGQMQVFIVPSDEFNAFVTDNQHMFVTVGAIVQSDTPNELIGVLAHETGHVAHQDNAKLQQVVKETKSMALIATLLGVGAAVAAGAAGSGSGAGAIGQGVMTAVPSIADRSLLAYRRTQEAAADRSALDYLVATGQSAKGFLTTLERLADENLFVSKGVDPYLQSHPLPSDRILTMQDLVKASPNLNKKDSAELQLRHDLVRAKLIGFTWTSGRVLVRYPATDNSLPARYARAISAYRFGPLASAQRQIDALIAEQPGNAYFLELKGQELLETGTPQAALDPLRKAVGLAPDAGLIKILLGQALMATNNKAMAKEAIEVLTTGLQRDPDEAAGYRALARAYDMMGDVPMAQLATAQGLFADGHIDDAKIQATRAQAKLPAGSPARLRADDIVTYKPPKF